MIINARSSPTSTKIHWSSIDGTNFSIRQSTISNYDPINMPSHKPNPNKQVHRKLINIDFHKYLGFRTLKSLKPFRTVAKPTVTFVDTGEIPISHGDFTINRNKSNKDAVERPKHFFDVAHMDITYGDTIAPGGIKYALVIVYQKNTV